MNSYLRTFFISFLVLALFSKSYGVDPATMELLNDIKTEFQKISQYLDDKTDVLSKMEPSNTLPCETPSISSGQACPAPTLACSDHTTRICDEGKNSPYPNKCTSNDDCFLGRVCNYEQRCAGNYAIPPCSAHYSKICDESTNSHGANKCVVDDDCSSGRICGQATWCMFKDW